MERNGRLQCFSTRGGQRLTVWEEENEVETMSKYYRQKADIAGNILSGSQGFSGHAKKCCDDLYSCLVTLRRSLSDIKAFYKDTQDLESACSDIETKLNDGSRCLDNQASLCHHSLSTSNIRTPFYQTLQQLVRIFHGYCDEPTIVTTSTTTIATTTTTTTTDKTTTTDIITTSTVTTTTTSSSAISTGPSLTQSSGGTINSTDIPMSIPSTSTIYSPTDTVGDQEVSYDDTIIIASSVIGSAILILVAVILVVFVCVRKRKSGPYDSDSSAQSNRGFIWKWLHSSKPDTQYTESEIYTEIDEAFMDAVYQLSRDPPQKVRDKIQHTAQINICYGAGLHDDDHVIPPTSEHNNVNTVQPDYEVPNPLNALDLGKTQNAIKNISSTRLGASVHDLDDQHNAGYQNVPLSGNSVKKEQKDLYREESNNVSKPTVSEENALSSKPGYQNISKPGISSNAVLVLPSQKGFITSRPAFTAVSQTTSGDYVQIEAKEVYEEVYAEPTEVAYDKTSKFGRTSVSKSPNIYNRTNLYDSTFETNRKTNRNQNTEGTNQPRPNYIYENPCLEY